MLCDSNYIIWLQIKAAMMKRPSQLIYGVDDKPNFLTLVLLGLQFAVTITTFLLLPVIVLQQAHVSSQIASSVVSVAMLIAGFTAILQVFKRGLIGSGYLILSSPNPVYIAPSIIAIQAGGLPLVFGMTLFSGIFQTVLSPVFKHLQKFFPAEIGGLIMTLIGVECGSLGINDFMSTMTTSTSHSLLPLLMGIFILLVILSMTIWGSKLFRLYALVISFTLGYVIVYISGFMSPAATLQIHQAHWFALPTFPAFSVGYSFNSSMLIPFIIASLACSIKVSGAVTLHQKLNDANWYKPDMNSISRGNFVDSLGTMLAGILGTFGQNTSSSALGLAFSSGVGCRLVAYSFAAIFWLLSFCPKFALILVLTPTPVVAAILLFLGATLVVSGLKTIIPRMTVSYRAVVIGVSFMLGISRDIYPDTYQHLPSYIQSLTGSSIALATISAIILNFIGLLSIDNVKTAHIVLNSDSTGYENGAVFLTKFFRKWAIPALLFEHALEAYKKLMTDIMQNNVAAKSITLDAQLKRTELDLTFSYEGQPMQATIPYASQTFSFKEGDLAFMHVSFDF